MNTDTDLTRGGAVTATDDTWTTPRDAARPLPPAESDDTAWAQALGGLGHGLLALLRPGGLEDLRTTAPPAPPARSLSLVPPPAEEPAPTADPWFEPVADPGAVTHDLVDAEVAGDLDAPLGRSLLDEDLRAAWTLDELPDDPPDPAVGIPLDPLADALAAAFVGEHDVPVAPEVPEVTEEPDAVWSARRDTIAMLEEIAFLDE